jgi:hypothetical protein
VLAREPAPLGDALGEALRRGGIELVLRMHVTAARRAGDDFVLELTDARQLRGDRLLVAAGGRPRVTNTDPQSATAARPRLGSAPPRVSEIAKTATYTHACAESNGFLTVLSDGHRLIGAYALGPEGGEWMQQATLAIRARVPLDVLRDTIQPFPSFSEIDPAAIKALREQIASARPAPDSARAAGLTNDTARRGRRTQSFPPHRQPEPVGQTVAIIGWQRRHRLRDRPVRTRCATR